MQKKNLIKRIASLVIVGTLLASTLAGCGKSSSSTTSTSTSTARLSANATSKEYFHLFYKPRKVPVFESIAANELAILIDLEDNNQQDILSSEELIKKSMISQKEVEIPQTWVKTGFGIGHGYYKATQKIIKVNRAVVTREWSQSADSGTSTKNQAIYAESKESIGFSQGMNIAAQLNNIDDAIKFICCYNAKSLADVLDTEIRSTVETVFNEICSKLKMEEIISDKEAIIKELKESVIPYFEERGITITTLGYKEGIDYEDASIQSAINAQVTSEKAKVTAENEAAKKEIEANARAKATEIEAEAKAKATVKEAEAEAEANKLRSESLTPEILESMKIEAIKDLDLPETMVGSDVSTMLGIKSLFE